MGWELALLVNHWHPAVRTAAAACAGCLHKVLRKAVRGRVTVLVPATFKLSLSGATPRNRASCERRTFELPGCLNTCSHLLAKPA
jgi:hypothetical protein